MVCNEGPYWTDSGRIQYIRKMGEIKWLFEATYDGRDFVVKFARDHYGECVYQLLAEHNFAPECM